MKYLLRIVLFTVIGLVLYGYYHKNSGNEEGDKWIGIGILLMAFVLMPLFIYHRYKNKKLEDYMYKSDTKNSENSENQ